MFRLLKKIFVFLIILGIVFGLAYWRSVKNKPNFPSQGSEYRQTRDELLQILNADEFNSQEFKQFLNKLPPYRLDKWPKEFWRSITFVDLRGDITTYQDIMIGIALGVDKLWQHEDPLFEVEKKVTDIISRRGYFFYKSFNDRR